MHYHDSDDLKLLRELKTLAPVEFKTFVEFDSIVGKEDGAIPRKYRELMAHRRGLHHPVPLLSRRSHTERQEGGRDPRGSRGSRVHRRGASRRRGCDARDASPSSCSTGRRP